MNNIKRPHGGFTLIEVLICLVMLGVLTAASAAVFQAVLLSWSSVESMAGVGINLGGGMERMSRDLRLARQVRGRVFGLANSEVRYETAAGTFFIFYLYHPNDSLYPPRLDQPAYQIRKAAITTITAQPASGSGEIMLDTLVVPPNVAGGSVLNVSGNVAILDIVGRRNNETIRLRSEVRPRNL